MHNRRSVRLRDYDYAQAGAYFVTICAWRKALLFGDVREGEMQLTPLGEIIAAEWTEAVERRPYVDADAFVVMPNHVHGIVRLANLHEGSVGRPHPAPNGPAPRSLAAFVGHFKSSVTRTARAHLPDAPPAIWHRSYHDHIIRTDRALHIIRRYISENPARWIEDRYHIS
jgi:REP element-mobilizing transposase RayT